MICINVWLLTFFAGISFVAVGIGGFTLFHFFMKESLKVPAELAFFSMIIAFILLALVYLCILIKAKKTTSELRHIIDIVASGGSVDEKRFTKFGSLGKGFNNVFHTVQDISEQRAKRIQFLNTAITMLFSLFDEPQLLLDANGIIIHVSNSYVEKYVPSRQKADILGTHIEKWYSEITTLQALNKEMVVTRSAVTVPCEKYDLDIMPLFNESSQPSGYLVEVGKVHRFSNKKLTDTASKMAERFADGISAVSRLKF